jgi:hypothetical protein
MQTALIQLRIVTIDILSGSAAFSGNWWSLRLAHFPYPSFGVLDGSGIPSMDIPKEMC